MAPHKPRLQVGAAGPVYQKDITTNLTIESTWEEVLGELYQIKVELSAIKGETEPEQQARQGESKPLGGVS